MVLTKTGKIKASKETLVTFTVPGGGDWSNTTIKIDKEHPITISSKSYDRLK